ncbi:hypothetical protein ACH5RR_037344 [Cinchona calisaya]|uniref:Uncharacterized protein n=1 Tax=Cinchona calisaya TaxID=153742 RepID=A0ABD2Y7B4_9GENT
MEVSENSKVEKIDDGSAKVEVEEQVDFGKVIELSSESVTQVEVEKEEEHVVEKSGSSEVTVEEKEVENLKEVSETEAPVKELVSSESEQKQQESYVSVDGVSAVVSETEAKTVEESALALPISDTNLVESSVVADSVCKEENVVVSSETIAVPPGDATENQQAAVLTPHRRNSWMNCCGLFDVLRRSDQ